MTDSGGAEFAEPENDVIFQVLQISALRFSS